MFDELLRMDIGPFGVHVVFFIPGYPHEQNDSPLNRDAGA